jgi:CheY-like chemotaxis protein
MMKSSSEMQMKILLVEDNPGDARLVSAMLSESGETGFEVKVAKRLEEAVSLMAQESFDAVLLDLSLPDSSGMETLDATRSNQSTVDTPIIVITGRYSEEQGVESMQHGAQDFLLKNNLRAEALIRSIRYAIERQKAKRQEEAAEAEKRQEREIESLEQFGAPAGALITARAYGLERLSEASADTFEALVEQYRDLIDQAIEQRKFKMDSKTSQGARVLAQRLGFLRASPRDVVELHLKALKTREPVKMTVSYVVAEEARLLLVELMGYLASYYRDHMLPVRSTKPSTSAQTQTDRSPK